jgi:hypothetical protein
MRARKGGVFAPLLAVIVAVSAAGCQTPTQITLVLTTDVPCDRVHGSAVKVAATSALDTTPTTASSGACSAGELGTLVIVPGPSGEGEVGVRAALALGATPADACRPGAPDCIVGTRALRFVKHTRLRATIALDGACAGVACEGGTTCSRGVCISQEVEPSACPTGCPDASGINAPGPDGAPDGAPDSAPDAPDDAATDASADAPFDAPNGTPCTSSDQCAHHCCCNTGNICDVGSICTTEGGGCT